MFSGEMIDTTIRAAYMVNRGAIRQRKIDIETNL